MCDAWLSALNRDETVGAIFLDFSEAFDVVNHSLLLEKLSVYLPKSNCIDIFQSYLTEKCQHVYKNCEKSETKLISSGAQQGSILGPLLFCLYIHDLPLKSNDGTRTNDMFADDSALYTSDKQLSVVQLNLQMCLNNVLTMY